MRTFQTADKLGSYLTDRNPRTYGRMSIHPPAASLLTIVSLFIKLTDPDSSEADRVIETSGDIGALDRHRYGRGLEILVIVGDPPKGFLIIDWSRFSVSCHNEWGALLEKKYF